jgi:tRNA(fMet)-specific endonuclease VapC
METGKVIDTNLLIEGETGLTTIFNVIEYPKTLESPDNEVIWPTRKDYLTAIEIMVGLLESGKPVPAIDIMIAAVCINRKLILETRDHHFEYIKLVNERLLLRIKKRRKEKR